MYVLIHRGNEGLIFLRGDGEDQNMFHNIEQKTHSVEVYANFDVSMDERKWI